MHLAAHPEQMTEVFADHQDPTDLVAAWVEETLRFDTSSQMLARHVTTDVKMHGQRIPAGAKLLVLIGSANRDAAVFTDPDTFSIHRAPPELSKSLSFGPRRPFCLGANLARFEAPVLLAELVRPPRGVPVRTNRAHP